MHEGRKSTSPASLQIDTPSCTASLDTADVSRLAANLFRYDTGRRGRPANPYRADTSPSAVSPSDALVLGPGRAGVVEQDRTAATASDDEYLLLTVHARRGVVPRLAERTMRRNRQKVLQIATSGVTTR